MKRATKSFIVGSLFGSAIVAGAIAYWPGVRILSEMSSAVARQSGAAISMALAHRQCLGGGAEASASAPESDADKSKKAFDCLLAWSPAGNADGIASAERIDEELRFFAATNKGDAKTAFASFESKNDPLGGLLLMELLRQSQSPERAELAAKTARELLPKIKAALIKSHQDAQELAERHSVLAAMGIVSKASIVESFSPPSVAAKALAAYWMTQHFDQVQAVAESDANLRAAKVAELKKTSTEWARGEWENMRRESAGKRV